LVSNDGKETILCGSFEQNMMTGYMLFDESSDYYKYNGTVQLSKQKFILLDLGVLTYKSGKVFVG
jgi:hypothetical protein